MLIKCETNRQEKTQLQLQNSQKGLCFGPRLLKLSSVRILSEKLFEYLTQRELVQETGSLEEGRIGTLNGKPRNNSEISSSWNPWLPLGQRTMPRSSERHLYDVTSDVT